MTLAEAAAELRAAITDEQDVHQPRLKRLAARIGLSADATGFELTRYERRAMAMRTAHDIIAAMIEGGTD